MLKNDQALIKKHQAVKAKLEDSRKSADGGTSRSYDSKTKLSEAKRVASTAPRADESKQAVVIDLDVLNSNYAEGLYGTPDLADFSTRLKANAKMDILASDTRWHRPNVELLMSIVGNRNLYVVGRYAQFEAKVIERLLAAYTPYAGYNKLFVGTEEAVRNQMQKDGIATYVWITGDATVKGPNYILVDNRGGLHYSDHYRADSIFNPPVDTNQRPNTPSSVVRG